MTTTTITSPNVTATIEMLEGLRRRHITQIEILDRDLEHYRQLPR